MALIQGDLSKDMIQFMFEVNKMKQDDANKAIEKYCDRLEKVIYNAIRSVTIIIPPGFIQVQGSPSAQANLTPIVLNDVVK